MEHINNLCRIHKVWRSEQIGIGKQNTAKNQVNGFTKCWRWSGGSVQFSEAICWRGNRMRANGLMSDVYIDYRRWYQPKSSLLENLHFLLGLLAHRQWAKLTIARATQEKVRFWWICCNERSGHHHQHFMPHKTFAPSHSRKTISADAANGVCVQCCAYGKLRQFVGMFRYGLWTQPYGHGPIRG